jgi:hypothetical protein
MEIEESGGLFVMEAKVRERVSKSSAVWFHQLQVLERG